MTEPIFFCNLCDFASASQNYEIFCTIQRLHPVVKQAGLDGPTGIANDEDQSVVCCEHTIGYEPFRIITRLIELDRELEARLQRHPDAALIRSLPGMGAILTAELIAEAGNLSRFRSADALALAAGMAPVLRQSGKTRFLKRPTGGNKGLKRVF